MGRNTSKKLRENKCIEGEVGERWGSVIKQKERHAQHTAKDCHAAYRKNGPIWRTERMVNLLKDGRMMWHRKEFCKRKRAMVTFICSSTCASVILFLLVHLGDNMDNFICIAIDCCCFCVRLALSKPNK